MNSKKGFTLVEVIIAMFVTTILLTAVYFMFIRVYEMNQEQTQFIKSQDSLRTVSQIVEMDIRKSSQYLTLEKTGEKVVIKFLDRDLNEITDNAGNALTKTYELKDEVLYRDNQYLMDHITSFELSTEISNREYIHLIVSSKTDKREVNHEKKIYLRKAE